MPDSFLQIPGVRESGRCGKSKGSLPMLTHLSPDATSFTKVNTIHYGSTPGPL